jgi:hypothetical protein
MIYKSLIDLHKLLAIIVNIAISFKDLGTLGQDYVKIRGILDSVVVTGRVLFGRW